jgi:hypothetical protein
MLEPWIIDQIRRREEQRRHGERPQLELPVPDRRPMSEDMPDEDPDKREPESNRGVAIIAM